jgi:single-stranded DNA-binding protein
MLQLQAIGNITRDEEVRQISGKDYTAFTIALNVKKDMTVFVGVRRPTSESDTFRQYLTKGRKVFVQGAMSVQAYISKQDGSAQPDITIWADKIELLSSNNNDQEGGKKPF